MITERKFAVAYTSFWREITPSADNFVRHINLATERFVVPFSSTAPAILNGAVNETAFRLCRVRWRNTLRINIDGEAECEMVWNDVCGWLNERPVERYAFTKAVYSDICEIAKNIGAFLSGHRASDIRFEPEFAGCGAIARCIGDITIDDELVEVKAGDRGFRATDLRQLFVYCALAHAAGAPNIRSICLMNPRSGVSWKSSLDDAATSCGASSLVELLDDIVRGTVLLGVSN